MKLGIIAPILGDGTSLYRALGPFSYIAKDTGAQIVTANEWDWTNIMGLDLMFLQRPFDERHVMVARGCKALNVPLWIDYDDLYTDFPNWALPQKFMYGAPRVADTIKRCIDLADVVTVSTEGLKPMAPDAKVIPNALNTHIWPLREGRRQQVISWRGSGGHFGDMDEVMPALWKLAATYPEWPQHYFGAPHFKVMDLGIVHPFSDPFSYMENFYELAPAVHIVPLSDCPFNVAKSNNAWLEATAVGALVIAPRLPEWRRPGIVNYNSPATFYETVVEVLNMKPEEREAMVNQSREYIKENLTLAVVNEQRMQILLRLHK